MVGDGDGDGDRRQKGVVLLSENRGAFASTKDYFLDNNEIKVLEVRTGTSSSSSWSQWMRVTLRQVFLPHGYPKSVSKDYVTYQIWDTVQAFASSITGALATEAVMKGVGVGNDAATPLAAALTWLLKSGSGHIGQIVFAWAKGTSLDYDCKKWRLFADGLNDVATFIDLIAPMFPTNMVVFVLCSASVARALVGVAGSATRAAVTQHQARMNNMADVSAKDGSQETLVNLVALITSLILLPVVSGKTMLVWLLYFFFTFVHLFANFNAVKSLQIETLNRPRLLMCLQNYLSSGRVPPVKTMNENESVILGQGIKDADVCGFQISLGVSLERALLSYKHPKRITEIFATFTSKPFLILPGQEEDVINVILEENIQPSDILEAFCRAVFTGVALRRHRSKLTTSSDAASLTQLPNILFDCDNEKNIEPMGSVITKAWDAFHKLALGQGFTFSQAPLDAGEWRAKWRHSE